MKHERSSGAPIGTRAIPRFSGAEAWAKLLPEQQQQIGAIALELVMAGTLPARVNAQAVDPRVLRACDAAVMTCSNLLDETAVIALASHFSCDDPLAVPSLIGDVCEGCGCTQDDACDGGCAWKRPHWCSACDEAPADSGT